MTATSKPGNRSPALLPVWFHEPDPTPGCGSVDRIAASDDSVLRVLRDPSFGRYFVGTAISNAGQFMQTLAVPFYMNELTDSNAWVGASGFAALVPAMLVTPIAGTLCDRMSRKLLLMGSLRPRPWSPPCFSCSL